MLESFDDPAETPGETGGAAGFRMVFGGQHMTPWLVERALFEDLWFAVVSALLVSHAHILQYHAMSCMRWSSQWVCMVISGFLSPGVWLHRAAHTLGAPRDGLGEQASPVDTPSKLSVYPELQWHSRGKRRI